MRAARKGNRRRSPFAVREPSRRQLRCGDEPDGFQPRHSQPAPCPCKRPVGAPHHREQTLQLIVMDQHDDIASPRPAPQFEDRRIDECRLHEVEDMGDDAEAENMPDLPVHHSGCGVNSPAPRLVNSTMRRVV